MSSPEALAHWREQLDTRFVVPDSVLLPCMARASQVLSEEGVSAYLAQARWLGKLGRGVEPMLMFLSDWPDVAALVGEDVLPTLHATLHRLWRSPNGVAIVPLLQSMLAVGRRLPESESFTRYLNLCLSLMDRTTGSIHGHHATFASPGLPEFVAQAPRLLQQLSLAGLSRWMDHGVRSHQHHPVRQREYFSLASADARAVLQRERHGTLFVDRQRALGFYLQALWSNDAHLVPFSTFDPWSSSPPSMEDAPPPMPYVDAHGMRVPDVYEDHHGVSGLDRYRWALAHMAAHQRWSQALVADNWSPFQRMAVEVFEDARIDALVMRQYPGLRPAWQRLHPHPAPGACDEARFSCLRHRLTQLSRALLDPAHGYEDPVLLSFVAQFAQALSAGDSSTAAMADLALSCVARMRRQSDQMADVFFEDTHISYRDDNRHLWIYIEEGDEEESFSQPVNREVQEIDGLPPRHYPEWDEPAQAYRPDWVSLYERLQPAGAASDIDRILARHASLAKQLERLLDALKPQDKVRERFQESGSELDLDVALRSLIDWRSGVQPDPRINVRHRTDGRDVAVLLLLDVSASLNDTVPGSTQTILELSQEAVALLAWAIDRLGDPLAIAAFQSNTRHDVRYHHIKGFDERWGDEGKARLAGVQAAYSTRMGAALRHAGHYLGHRSADKKLLLVLTDGRPSDVDTPDEQVLVDDTRQAVRELAQAGVYTHCISLDAQADDYVGAIFGQRHTVIDHIERLPERLPQVFLSLTA
jgi:hypothetical protein